VDHTVCQAASKLAKEEVAAEVTMTTTGAASEEVAVVPGCTAEVGDPDPSLGDLKACSFRHPAVSSSPDLNSHFNKGSGPVDFREVRMGAAQEATWDPTAVAQG